MSFPVLFVSAVQVEAGISFHKIETKLINVYTSNFVPCCDKQPDIAYLQSVHLKNNFVILVKKKFF